MTIQTEVSDGIAWVTLNRPGRSNAVNVQMHQALTALWPRLESDPAVSVIVLTGAGERAFCAGADVEDFLPWLAERVAAGEDPSDFCGLTRRRPGKPLVAAINGAAMGGGLELALAADVRIAADHAVLALPEVRRGTIAGAGGVTRLPRMLPAGVARDMILTGRSITAARAHELGLVSDVVPPAGLRACAADLARMIAANAPLATAACRALMDDGEAMSLDEALDAERAAFRRLTTSEDFAEGIAAFRARRDPVYRGR